MKKSNWNVKVNGKGIPVNDIVSRFWDSRSISNPEEFLHPKGNILPSTMFENIQPAASLMVQLLENKATFMIYADVDTDGCCSAAILYHYVTAHNCECSVYINSKKEHGVTKEFIEKFLLTDVVIVVDSINNNMEMYDKILERSKLIVLDHHIPTEEVLSNASKINLVSSAVNYPNSHLSGSGVTWKFVNYVDFLMNTNYSDDLIDLAAVGIIADVCNVGAESMENREICDIGFKHVVNSGIKAIVNNEELTSDSIAFSIAPLVNAANRLDNNELALSLFLCDSVSQGRQIVKELTKIKDTQKSKVAELFKNFEKLASEQSNRRCYYFIVDETVGCLSGLLATKAADKWKRPCIVVRDTPQGYAGSMRANSSIDFRKIVNDSGLADCQGHENSAGILINKETFEEFQNYIEAQLENVVEIDTTENVDIGIERIQITPFLINRLKQINRICGPGFPAVTVFIENVQRYIVKKMSQGKHLCVEVPDMKFLYWNFEDWDSVFDEGSLSAIGTLDESFFAGKHSIQMVMQDYIFSQEPVKFNLW